MTEKNLNETLSEFLQYLTSTEILDFQNLPSLSKLSKQLKVSIASLREQLEVARMLGIVEVKPKTGIRRLPYQFRGVVRQSLAYAISLDRQYFQSYSNLRNHIEAAYWIEAVELLIPEDLDYLQQLVINAFEKLNGDPIRIPHWEHKELHLTIYRRLNNVYVSGILEGYWDLYEAVGLSLFTEYQYLHEVWRYHQQMVEAIISSNYQASYQLMIEHIGLLQRRTNSTPKMDFE